MRSLVGIKKLANFEKRNQMNVHLVRNSDLGCGTFDNIISYLNYVKDKKKQNPIKFIGHAVDPTKDVDIIIDREEMADHIKRINTDGTPYDRNDFKNYFDVCESIRTRDNITSSEIVILLTNQYNTSNYFGYCDDDIKNVFIQCSDWTNIFTEKFNYELAICYETHSWILRHLLFNHRETMRKFVNNNIPKGCVMDNCTNKKDFLLKIRTADVSENLLTRMLETNFSSYPYMYYILKQFERIRLGVLTRERSEIFSSYVTINFNHNNGNNCFTIDEYEGVELKFELVQRVIYRLVLNYPEGVQFESLQNESYYNEIISLFDEESSTNRNDRTIYESIEKTFGFYLEEKDQEDPEIKFLGPNTDSEIEKIINNGIKKSKESFRQKVSKLNECLSRMIPSKLIDQYQIQYDDRTRRFTIKLDREYIVNGRLPNTTE